MLCTACRLDESMFHVAVDLIHCIMCGCILKFGGNIDCNLHFISKAPLTMGLRTVQTMKKYIYLTISAALYNFLTKLLDMVYQSSV